MKIILPPSFTLSKNWIWPLWKKPVHALTRKLEHQHSISVLLQYNHCEFTTNSTGAKKSGLYNALWKYQYDLDFVRWIELMYLRLKYLHHHTNSYHETCINWVYQIKSESKIYIFSFFWKKLFNWNWIVIHIYVVSEGHVR